LTIDIAAVPDKGDKGTPMKLFISPLILSDQGYGSVNTLNVGSLIWKEGEMVSNLDY
jgi:hypothetical protein